MNQHGNPSGRPISPATLAAVARVMAGEPVATVAAATGVPRRTIYGYMARCNLVAPAHLRRGCKAKI